MQHLINPAHMKKVNYDKDKMVNKTREETQCQCLLMQPHALSTYISRVSDQNGVSVLFIMLEIHHSGREPSIYKDKHLHTTC